MKKVIFGLIVGLAIGYTVGYGHGSRGEPSIWKRTMDKFGATRLKEENARQQQIMDSISRPR